MKNIIIYYYTLSIYIILSLFFLLNFILVHINVVIMKNILIVSLLLWLPILICLGISKAFGVYKENKSFINKGNNCLVDNISVETEEKYSKGIVTMFKVLYCIYGIVFALFMGMVFVIAGDPREIDGIYYLVSHGDIIKEISYNEYKYESLIIVQGFLSVLITVSQMAVIKFKKVKKNNDIWLWKLIIKLIN